MKTWGVKNGEYVVLISQGTLCQLHGRSLFPLLLRDVHKVVVPGVSIRVMVARLSGLLILRDKVNALFDIGFLYLAHLMQQLATESRFASL